MLLYSRLIILLQIVSGKVGIHFPSKNAFIFNSENIEKDISLREILNIFDSEGNKNIKKDVKPTGIEVYILVSFIVVLLILLKRIILILLN